MSARWTGPVDGDYANAMQTELKAPVPPERWPYGPPDAHEDCCLLHCAGLYCDCLASDASTEDASRNIE